MFLTRKNQFILIALLGFLLLSFFQPKDHNARIKFLIGKVDILPSRKTDWEKAKYNMAVASGDRIRTALNARAELQMPDGSVIRIRENTIFDVKEIKTPERHNEDKMSFTLWAGDLWAQFKKVVSDRQTREIESPSAVVAVRGTTLEINVDQNRATRVRVFEGRVNVKAKDVAGEVTLTSNQESTVEQGKPPTPPSGFTADDDTEDEEEDAPAGALILDIKTSKFQYTDPAVLTGGVRIFGRTSQGAQVTANDVPLNVSPNGNFDGRVRVQEGLNTIRIIATKDDLEKSGTIRMYVNTKKPQIRLSKPLVSGYVNRRDYSLSGAVFDGTPGDQVKVMINDEEVAEVQGSGSFNRTIILNEGKNDIRVVAVDRSQNSREITERIFLDTVKPVITITEPAQQVFVRFEPPPPPGDNPNRNFADEKFRQTIRGLIIDPEPSSGIKRIAINGKDIQPNSDGSFEAEVIVKRSLAVSRVVENRLSIVVEDLAGNITRDNTRKIIIR